MQRRLPVTICQCTSDDECTQKNIETAPDMKTTKEIDVRVKLPGITNDHFYSLFKLNKDDFFYMAKFPVNPSGFRLFFCADYFHLTFCLKNMMLEN